MATFAQNDIQRLFIGQDAAKSTGGISTLNDGEIGIFTPAGTRVTEATAATINRFIIVKKTPSGGIPLVSGVIDKRTITRATRGLYIASADQISYIGYDGTTGSIELFNENKYHVRISIRQGRTSAHGGLYLKHAFYTSDANATQFEIAHNLLKALSVEFTKEPDRIIKSEMLSDDAGAALGAGTLSVVNGSKYIVASSASHALVAGDVVRIGGTTTAIPVYVVDTVNGTEIKLTTIYQGTTATGVAGEELTATTGAFGIKLTGVSQPFRVGKLDQDGQPLIFDITLEDFGATTYRYTAPTAGSGNERQIKSLEFFAQGNEGNYLRMGEPLVFPGRTEASGNYDMIDLEIQEVYKDSMVAGPIDKQFTLAIPQTTPAYAVTGTADDITDVLEVLVYGAVNGNLTI